MNVKVLMSIVLGIGLLGFVSAAMAQDSELKPTSKACQYLTPEEIGSVLGSAIHQAQFQTTDMMCLYGTDEGAIVASVSITGTNYSNEMLNNAYQQTLKVAKPLEGIGAMAAEALPEGFKNYTTVYFFKNGINGNVTVQVSQDQNQSKTEALAKLIVSKL